MVKNIVFFFVFFGGRVNVMCAYSKNHEAEDGEEYVTDTQLVFILIFMK